MKRDPPEADHSLMPTPANFLVDQNKAPAWMVDLLKKCRISYNPGFRPGPDSTLYTIEHHWDICNSLTHRSGGRRHRLSRIRSWEQGFMVQRAPITALATVAAYRDSCGCGQRPGAKVLALLVPRTPGRMAAENWFPNSNNENAALPSVSGESARNHYLDHVIWTPHRILNLD